MKSKALTCITAITLFAALAVPVQPAAQHTRYKLIDIGTLGGPNSSVGFEPSPLNALSSLGVFTACADTSAPDPNYPNFNPFILHSTYGLPLPDPGIFHACQWKNGTLTDLSALPGVNSSCSTHISGNGLIAGASENGIIDPITGWPESQAVLWKHGQITDLGTLGGNESFSTAVTNRGQVVALAENTAPYPFPYPGIGQTVDHVSECKPETEEPSEHRKESQKLPCHFFRTFPPIREGGIEHEPTKISNSTHFCTARLHPCLEPGLRHEC